MYTGIVPDDAVALQLGKMVGDNLVCCEAMEFRDGVKAVRLALNRASISGRVEVGGEIDKHLADVYSANGDLIETVALDKDSYRILKTRWMRCRIEKAE